MRIKILKDKMYGMKNLAKNRESWQFSQSWYIRNPSSILPIQDKKRNPSSMNELGDILLGEVNKGLNKSLPYKYKEVLK
jgi:hypothetical protein